MDYEDSISMEVPLQHAEEIRRYLIKENLINTALSLKKDKAYLYIPIKDIKHKNLPYRLVTKRFVRKKAKIKSYKEKINNILSTKELDDLPTSYDILGDIILIKLPKSLVKYKNKIGQALIQTNKNVKTVCLIDSVKGECRIRDCEIIAGEKNTLTQHKEYGLKFYIDVKKTYFSPRLATERKRIADLVKPDEIILDLFTGVAPFPCTIAKFSKPKLIYAVDKNRDAITLAYKNIKINRFLDKIEVINSDSKEILKEFFNKKIQVNRVIMNLPFSSNKYFVDVLKLIKKGAVIHFYTIINEKEIDKRVKDLEIIAKNNRIKILTIVVNKIKSYSPREFYICVDITAKKMPM